MDFSDQQPPKKQCHHRIHKRIGRYARCRAFLQNINVSVNPTIDPNTIKYAMRPRTRRYRTQWSALTSPETIPAIQSETPPARLCIATPSRVNRKVPRNVSSKPSRWPTPTRRLATNRPQMDRRGPTLQILRPDKSANPANPSSNPAATRPPGRVPSRAQPVHDNHPQRNCRHQQCGNAEGTVRSARHTPPFPTPSNKKPVMKDMRQCAGVWSHPRLPAQDWYRIKPVRRWREQPQKWWKDSIPTRIARYVDPHTRYTSPNAMITRVEVRGGATAVGGTGLVRASQ